MLAYSLISSCFPHDSDKLVTKYLLEGAQRGTEGAMGRW